MVVETLLFLSYFALIVWIGCGYGSYFAASTPASFTPSPVLLMRPRKTLVQPSDGYFDRASMLEQLVTSSRPGPSAFLSLVGFRCD